MRWNASNAFSQGRNFRIKKADYTPASTVSCETWIQPIIPCGIEGDRLYLQVENEFYREMLEKGKLYTGLSTACG